MFEPAKSENKSVMDKMMQQTTELKTLLKQSSAENARLKQQVQQLQQTNALLSSQIQATKQTSDNPKPTKPVRQNQLTISSLGEQTPTQPPPNKYAAHFQQKRQKDYLEEQLERSKMIESQLQQSQLTQQVAEEEYRFKIKNKFDEEQLSERDQMRDVIRAQAKRINTLEEYVAELKRVPAYRRAQIKLPTTRGDSLPQQVRELQTKLIELKYRGTQAAMEADNGDGALGVAAVMNFQHQLQLHVDQLRDIGQKLSDRAWAIQRKIDEARTQ